jgi:hypothetical protein
MSANWVAIVRVADTDATVTEARTSIRLPITRLRQVLIGEFQELGQLGDSVSWRLGKF